MVLHSSKNGNSKKDYGRSDYEESSLNLQDIHKSILVIESELKAYSKTSVEVFVVDKEVTPTLLRSSVHLYKKKLQIGY